MVRKIVKGTHIFLEKAIPATPADKQVITDLLDTLRANRETCVGMAANMIGINKAIIVVAAGPFQFAMVNPVITKKSGGYSTEESCHLSQVLRRLQQLRHFSAMYLSMKES